MGSKLNVEIFNTAIALKANTVDVYNKAVLYTRSENDVLLSQKSNAEDVYTKITVNALLNDKLDISTFNTNIILKANTTDIYNKSLLYTETESDTLLLTKLNNNALNNYYMQTGINQSFSNYYNKAYGY